MQQDAETDLETWQMIRRHPIFHGLTEEEIQMAMPYFRNVVCQRGDVLMREDLDTGSDLFLVLEGKLEVIKKTVGNSVLPENESPDQFIIAQVNAGDSIGEVAFINGESRSATVICLSKSTLLSLSPRDLLELESKFPRTSTQIMKNMVGYVGNRLRRTSENEVKALKVELEHSKQKSKANLFFSYVICLLCVYNLTLQATSTYASDANRASIVSAIIVMAFGLVLYLMTRQSNFPLNTYGITTRNWRPALKESLLFSVLAIVLMITVKWLLIQNMEKYHHLPLIDFNLDTRYLGLNFLLYGLHCPVQEFVARGVLQSSLENFFTGRNSLLRAILVSNALFCATHVHVMGGLLALIVFVPGLFWGWLFSRHKTLIGVSVSHLLVGWTALFFLNLESLF